MCIKGSFLKEENRKVQAYIELLYIELLYIELLYIELPFNRDSTANNPWIVMKYRQKNTLLCFFSKKTNFITHLKLLKLCLKRTFYQRIYLSEQASCDTRQGSISHHRPACHTSTQHRRSPIHASHRRAARRTETVYNALCKALLQLPFTLSQRTEVLRTDTLALFRLQEKREFGRITQCG